MGAVPLLPAYCHCQTEIFTAPLGTEEQDLNGGAAALNDIPRTSADVFPFLSLLLLLLHTSVVMSRIIGVGLGMRSAHPRHLGTRRFTNFCFCLRSETFMTFICFLLIWLAISVSFALHLR